jgi:thiamine transport system ATP-binding protein
VVTVLEVSDLRIDYEGQVLLDHVNLTVGAGEVVALLGPSGSGKSTLLRCIAGVQRPESGDIRWEGASVLDIPAYRRGFGLVFQDPLLFPHRDVGANVAFGMKARDDNRVAHLLTLVGLSGFQRRDPSTLSGGEAQRVALARALAAEPRLLLLDEPFGALDTDLRERLVREVRSLLTSAGVPAIHVTHDRSEADAISDRVVTLAELTG